MILDGFLQSIVENPEDESVWLMLADWLDERDDSSSELVRLQTRLRQYLQHPERPLWEQRLQQLLLAGVVPCGPRYTNVLSMEFAWIPPSTFLMGSPEDDFQSWTDQRPRHKVTLSRGFYMGVYPVTQKQWLQIMDGNPSHFKGDDLPLESVTWDECQEFCRRLRERLGEPYRLPTEAEWEYACRAGTTSEYYTGEGLDALKKAGWCSYDENWGSGKQTKPVHTREFQPNAFGLYHMHGNVMEWCQDLYVSYSAQDQMDPEGTASRGGRILRGGSWHGQPRGCRAAFRCYAGPDRRDFTCGCRVCFSRETP